MADGMIELVHYQAVDPGTNWVKEKQPALDAHGPLEREDGNLA